MKQIIWIRVGALGDLLVSTSALEKTFERFPDSQLWILGDRFWLELLQPKQWPRLNGIIVRKRNQRGQLYVPSSDSSWKSQGDDLPLSAFYRKADITVNLRIESYRFAWGPFFARVPIRIGSCPWPMKWLYTHWSPWLGKEPAIHERDWYVEVASAPRRKLIPLGTVAENRGQLLQARTRPTAGLPPLKKPDPETIFKLTSENVSLPPVTYGNYWLVNPTSSRLEKAWPAEKFRQFCLQWSERLKPLQKTIVITGAPNETDWLNEVAKDDFHVIQPPTLNQLIDVVAGANALVTNTSSVQFVAAGAGTPSITLMGRSQPLRWGPVGANDRVVQALPIKGTYKNIFDEEKAAYEAITLEQVLSTCEHFLASHLDP